MTLAELKRNANTGKMSVELIERYGETGDNIIERLRGKRQVLKANSVGLVILNSSGKESELRINSAKLLDYDGKSLVIYQAGEREPTTEEKAVLDEWNGILEKHKKENPYGDTYWKKVAYFKKSPCPWMSGFSDIIRGKRYLSNGKVLDNQVKGEAILKYKVYMYVK